MLSVVLNFSVHEWLVFRFDHPLNWSVFLSVQEVVPAIIFCLKVMESHQTRDVFAVVMLFQLFSPIGILVLMIDGVDGNP